MEHFRVRPLSEADIDAIVLAAGGRRAHEDADKREKPGADYLLAEAVIELKSLEDEGLAKPERQSKLAVLFREHEPKRPVIVLDRQRLPEAAQRRFDEILEGPVYGAVRKAKKQLPASRAAYPKATTSVLLVINNGYTALDHDALVQLVARRARLASEEIDGIVVAGCYFYSDTFDSDFLWPIDYVPINVQRPFSSYEAFRSAWNAFSEKFMTAVVRGEVQPGTIKGPVVDTHFDVDGVTYVKPAPPMGKDSDFFGKSRPRKDSSGLEHCPTVARTFPEMTCDEWGHFRNSLAANKSLGAVYQEWRAARATAAAETEPLKPFVPIQVGHSGWLEWRKENGAPPTMRSVCVYANALFEQRVRALFESARERSATGIIPTRYILVETEEIGQDRANDVSHIAVIRKQPRGDPVIRKLVANARIFHEHALMLACAYGVGEGVESVLWEKDLRYAWL